MTVDHLPVAKTNSSCVVAGDIDGDGDQDLILGNRGENFYFEGTKEKPIKLWLNDFDNNKKIPKLDLSKVKRDSDDSEESSEEEDDAKKQ